MKKILLILLSVWLCLPGLYAQAPFSELYSLKTPTGTINGRILVPKGGESVPVVLLVAGSGPTDRDGNQHGMQNNSLKLLAEALYREGIASVRFDKRGVSSSRLAGGKEADMRFETYIDDLRGWIAQLAADKKFNAIYIAGHSEGSLVGIVASRANPAVAGLISIAGAGRPADALIREQMAAAPAEASAVVHPILDSLKAGKTVENTPQALDFLFRPSVQPYMISWMKYDPAVEIAALTIPVLIVQGTTDVQISIADARLLFTANPTAEIALIKNMNHVLKECPSMDMEEQAAVYNSPSQPLSPELVPALVAFIKSHPKP